MKDAQKRPRDHGPLFLSVILAGLVVVVLALMLASAHSLARRDSAGINHSPHMSQAVHPPVDARKTHNY